MLSARLCPGLCARTVGEPRGGIRAVSVPDRAWALCTLERPDYADAFVVELADPLARTARRWMSAIFDDAPQQLRLSLWLAWRALGLRLGSPFSGSGPLGWEVETASPDVVLMSARSRIGMPAQLLLHRQSNSLLLDTFIQQETAIARAIWTATEPTHRRAVPIVLADFQRRVSSTTR